MSLNQTPRGERPHIALFGRRNAGKSSLINALTNQSLSLVSDVKGTTTDPVYKAMELLPIGPVVLIDTAGFDDTGVLGDMRVKKTIDVLNKTDCAIVVLDATQACTKDDEEMIARIKGKNIPVIVVLNKIDLIENKEWTVQNVAKQLKEPVLDVSAEKKQGIEKIKHALCKKIPATNDTFRLVGDLLNPGDFVVLVVPIDKAAPKGRLILPQQQVIRDVLEADAMCVVTKEYELRETLEKLGVKPKLVITDSQVFSKVSADTPKDILLTSFSILFARFKGDLKTLVNGARALDSLQHGDRILVVEGCTHHRQCDDIGSVKIPRWMRQYTGKKLEFDFASGTEFPEDITNYALIVHCGGCMLNRREVKYRIQLAQEKGVDVVNYGVLIAMVNGILKRAIEPFQGI